MKYLKIENNKGFYWDGKEYQEIDKIDKNGLLITNNRVPAIMFQNYSIKSFTFTNTLVYYHCL